LRHSTTHPMAGKIAQKIGQRISTTAHRWQLTTDHPPMCALLVPLIFFPLAAAGRGDWAAAFEEASFTYSGGEYQDEVFRYRLLRPEKIRPGKKYPVVLFLHGKGARGDDNLAQLEFLPKRMAQPQYRH